jgi:nucleotide-binding universal stress UspA family protein
MKLEHILIPTDFSDNSRLALDWAAALREKFPARLTLLHVLETIVNYGTELSFLPVDVDTGREQSAHAHLKEQAATLGGSVQTVCLRDTPWRGICEWAAAHAVDLIVMPTHGHSGLKHLWLGSVAERVVRKAPCPVLTIPAGG